MDPLPGPLAGGTVLRDRYRIVETLGESRVATTYLADDTDARRRCVIKELSVARVIRTSTGAESYSGDFTKLIELFEREARVLANLAHPGVPRLLDHFTLEDGGHARLYMVQEFVKGKNLASLVEGGRHFREAEVVSIARKVAEILAHLHALSPPLVHRDIKPSNIMLSERGAVHLIDFGAVKTTLETDDLGGQTVVGTFGYMPMEQYEGRALPASDVYAIGATLLFLLSHKAPHELPRRGVKIDFRGHVNVSAELARVLERMVEPAPEDRFRDGAELGRALERLGERPAAPRGRIGALAGAGAALILAVAAITRLIPGAHVSGTGAAGSGSAPRPGPPSSPRGGSPPPIRPVNGVLTVDLYRDFRYVPEGWPMGRSVSQTGFGTLREWPRETLVEPTFERRPDRVLYGALQLGNGPDPQISLALAEVGGAWELYVDADNDEDLTDDGPPLSNQGSGTVMAARLTVEVETDLGGGRTVKHPYGLWMWFVRAEGTDLIDGRFYAIHHWAGSLEVGGVTYAATAFEYEHHDALYREGGLCIDLDRDGKCTEERELFLDGDVVPFPGAAERLGLRYP